MADRAGKIKGILVVTSLMVAALLLATRALRTTPAVDDAAVRQKIAHYIREKFGLLDRVRVTVLPLEEFSNPGFYETTVTFEDGSQKQSRHVILTKDRRFMILGNTYPLGQDARAEIARHVRAAFKLPASTDLSVGEFRNSPIPGLLATAITAQSANRKAVQDFYVTADNHLLLLGTAYDLNIDPRGEAMRIIDTQNQPSAGAANAPVTVVEYSDLQCASCSRMHEFLRKQVLAKYGDKVRIVFKEFPLPSIHGWALMGSIANQCAYRMKPDAYAAYRSLIFANQSSLNAANARNLLIDYGVQVGIDRLQLAACIDSKATLPRVEQNYAEGQAVGVHATPTSFVNGKMVVGLPSPDVLYKAIDDALRAAR